MKWNGSFRRKFYGKQGIPLDIFFFSLFRNRLIISVPFASTHHDEIRGLFMETSFDFICAHRFGHTNGKRFLSNVTYSSCSIFLWKTCGRKILAGFSTLIERAQ